MPSLSHVTAQMVSLVALQAAASTLPYGGTSGTPQASVEASYDAGAASSPASSSGYEEQGSDPGYKKEGSYGGTEYASYSYPESSVPSIPNKNKYETKPAVEAPQQPRYQVATSYPGKASPEASYGEVDGYTPTNPQQTWSDGHKNSKGGKPEAGAIVKSNHVVHAKVASGDHSPKFAKPDANTTTENPGQQWTSAKVVKLGANASKFQASAGASATIPWAMAGMIAVLGYLW